MIDPNSMNDSDLEMLWAECSLQLKSRGRLYSLTKNFAKTSPQAKMAVAQMGDAADHVFQEEN